MKPTKAFEAIVLRQVKTGEADLTLTLFSADGVSYITAKGALKPTAKMKAEIQPLNVCEFQTSGQTLTGANLILNAMPLARDINKYYVACAVAETLRKLEFDNSAEKVFALSKQVLTDLIGSKKSLFVLFIDYYYEVLKTLGYAIQDFAVPEKLGLAEAKQLISALVHAFRAYLDFEIPNTQIFFEV
ncbi:MAG: recombination protein O N-terminal domain-containing protein [Christensenellaceae bacterium]|jgi:DNA repair protein RecO|nr:recombination protein O N-terminal domain-containing protein [Christensenellaceae bacterium]